MPFIHGSCAARFYPGISAKFHIEFEVSRNVTYEIPYLGDQQSYFRDEGLIKAMKITLAAVLPRRSRTKSEPSDRLLADYTERIARYTPCDSEIFETEAALLEWLARQPGRAPAYAILLDSRGKQLSSEELAERVGRLRDDGTQRLVFAVGPGGRLVRRLTPARRFAALAGPDHAPASAGTCGPGRAGVPRIHHSRRASVSLRPLKLFFST